MLGRKHHRSNCRVSVSSRFQQIQSLLFLLRKSGQFFYNTSKLDLKMLMGDQDHVGENLRAYDIPFNRHFYVFKPPRPLAEIDADLKGVTDRILTMIGGLTA
jgi:hypothetical protein